MPARKRICIITSSFPTRQHPIPGSMIPYYAAALKKARLDVFIFTPFKSGDALRIKGVSVFQFKADKALDSSFARLNFFNPVQVKRALAIVMKGGWELVRFCQEKKIDYCLACWAIPAGFWALRAKKKLKIPYMVWSLGSDIHTWAHFPVIRSIIKTVLKNADWLFADGIGLARQMTRLSGHPAAYLPSTTEFSGLKGTKRKLVDVKKFNFLFSGRWERVKGIDILFRSFDFFFRHHTAEFYLTGDGALSKSLIRGVEGKPWRPHIHVLGLVPRDHLARYMRDCDALIIPSRKESIPYVFSEAIKNKLPIVATKAGDLGFLLKKYKVGISVDSFSSLALARGLSDMMRYKSQKQYFFKGQKLAEKIFDIGKSVRSIAEKIYG